MEMIRRWIAAGCAVLAAGSGFAGQADVLPDHARLAIIGDSITEARKYSVYMETYLLACAGRRDITVFQFGWSGEQAGGFAARADNDLAVFKPDAATTCYGMNDGLYKPYTETVGAAYGSNLVAVIGKLRAAGVQTIVAGSPGVVDADTYRQSGSGAKDETGKAPSETYNETLRQLRNIAAQTAAEQNTRFADVYTPMMNAMHKAKAEKGPSYDVAGKDGVHPGDNGHLIMASAFLKALGCDGNIGTIAVDMQGGASTDAGHEIVLSSRGRVEIESTRYPFCFQGDASSGTRSILPFFPFNRDLNRLTLKVTRLTAPAARVTWGTESHDFPAEQLAAGINLMEFFEKPPFETAFFKVKEGVEAKQDLETRIIKGFLTAGRPARFISPRQFLGDAGMEQLTRLFMEVHAGMDAANKAAVIPVRHVIEISPLQE